MHEKKHTKFPGFFKALCISFFLTLVFIMVDAAISYWLDIPDKVMSLLLLLSSCVGVLVSGLLFSKRLESRGIVHGAVLGLSYFAVILAVSAIVNQGFSFSMQRLTLLVAVVCSASLGGILGINSSKG